MIQWPHRVSLAIKDAEFSFRLMHGGRGCPLWVRLLDSLISGRGHCVWYLPTPPAWVQDSHWMMSAFSPSRTLAVHPFFASGRNYSLMSCNLSAWAFSEHWLYWILVVGWLGHCIWNAGISPGFCTCWLRTKSMLISHSGFYSTNFMEHTWGLCQHHWILVDIHPFFSIFNFNQCSYFLHQFEKNTIIWLIYSKHNILSQFWLSSGPICCTDSQLWIAHGLSKATQLFLSKLMLSFLNKVQSHQLHCCKCLTGIEVNTCLNPLLN